jgi:hypothetical protein
MNKTHLTLLAALLLSLASVQAAEDYEIIYGRRCTFKDLGTRVTVWKQSNKAYLSPPSADTVLEADRELTHIGLYPDATLLVSGIQYQFRRNCHDFAWSPWMFWENYPDRVAWVGAPDYLLGPTFTTLAYNQLGPQKEAWEMGHSDVEGKEFTPRPNWQDGSFVDAAQSQYRPGEWYNLDFLFATSALDTLQYEYPDMLGSMNGILQSNPRTMIGLPVCDLADPNTIPQHSAVLVDWFTPAGFPSSVSAGVYVSKWGEGGVWLHRWGYGLCPDDLYKSTEQLHVFAPSSAWGGLEYWVLYSFW